MADKKKIGILSAKTTEKFLDMVIENAPLLKLVTVARVTLPTGTYPVVTMAQNKTRGFTNAHNNSTGRQTIATLQSLNAADVNYSVKELVLPLLLQDSYTEDMESTPEKVAEMFAKVFAKDVQKMAIAGDVDIEPAEEGAPTDEETMLAVLDGMVKQMVTLGATVEYTDAENTVNKKLMKLLKGCPDDFLANPDSKVYISPTDMNTLWDEAVTTKTLIKERDGRLYFRGKYEFVEVPGLAEGCILFGDMTGVLVVLMRDVTLETQRYPEARGTKAVLSTRVDVVVHPFVNMRMLVPEPEEPEAPPAGGGGE